MEIDIAPDTQGNEQGTSENFTDKWWLAPHDEAERSALHARNLEMFRKKYRGVYEAVAAFTPKSKLVFNEDGQPDLEFADNLFYNGDIEGFTTRQLAKYWKNPNRLHVNPPTPQSMDSLAGQFLHNMLQRMTADVGVEFTIGRTSSKSFYGLVMGVGLGRHLPEFIERTGCRNLFILDPNLEGFYHSLSLLDWEAVLFEIQKRDGDVFMYIGGLPQNWMDGLRFQTRNTNTISLDGFYIYAHYQNSLFSEFSKKFNNESQFLMTGLGFFYDEQLMLRNTYSNMMDRSSHIYLRKEPAPVRTTPAIIVGCGPSLDDNIEDIKRNADNAVIFSCGSALGPLMDAGIRPDFQLELENIRVLPVLMYAASKHDLSGICLVASSTVDREIKDYFSDIVYWFRPALCPFPIFSDNMANCLRHPDPTVVNVGLTFAQEMGFREYYLFGTDMGQKGNNQHHAKASFHYSDEAKNEKVQEFNIEVPANFGGKANTSSGLFWALDTLQRAIGYSGMNSRYYNCSNGVRINRAVPKLSRTLNLPEPEVSRADTVKDILDSFPIMSKEEVNERWQPEKMIEAIDSLLDDLLDIVESQDLVTSTDHLIELSRRFYAKQDSRFDSYAGLTLRGTVNQVFIAADFYLCRINDEDKYAAALDVFRDEYRILSERMRETVRKQIRAQRLGYVLPDEYLSGVQEDDGLTDDQRAQLLIPQDDPAPADQ